MKDCTRWQRFRPGLISRRASSHSIPPRDRARIQGGTRHYATSALLAMSVTLGACNSEPKWRGTPVNPAITVPALAFADSVGTPIQFMPAKGEAAMLFFGYTNCPDVCPTTLADWVRVRGAMGDDARRVHFVFVSVDPERDTPAIAQRYAAQFDSTFIGLSGSAVATAALQQAFAVGSAKQPSSSAEDYVVVHPAQTFLIDDSGNVRVSYGFGAGWDKMASDLKELLR